MHGLSQTVVVWQLSAKLEHFGADEVVAIHVLLVCSLAVAIAHHRDRQADCSIYKDAEEKPLQDSLFFVVGYKVFGNLASPIKYLTCLKHLLDSLRSEQVW